MLFFAGGEFFVKWVLIVVEVGVVVIDNILYFCYDYDIFFVVFEVNLEVIVEFCNCNIIVNLNCLII